MASAFEVGAVPASEVQPSMLVATYRFNSPIAVMTRENDCYRIREFPAGWTLVVTNPNPDSNNMIHGVCRGKRVRVFLRDLEERAEHMVFHPVGQ